MNKKEYLLKQYLDYLNSSPKEKIISSIEPLIRQLPEDTLEKLLDLSNANIDPYFIANKKELLDIFFEMGEMEIYGYITYDSWHDSNFEYSLEEYDKKILSNVIELICYLYDHDGELEAYSLADHLYSITFNCTFYDEYDDKYDENETYDINEVFYKLDCRHLKDKLDNIYLKSLIRNRNVELIIKYLYKHDTHRSIDVIYKENHPLLYDLACYILNTIKSLRHLNDSTYIFELLDDYNLFKEATYKYFINTPHILSKFVEIFYDGGEGKHDDEIAEIVNELLFSIYEWYYHYESTFVSLLKIFPSSELITRYYILYDEGDEPFIIFNCLEDDIFYKHIKPSDKKRLTIKTLFIEKGYGEVRYIVKAIFGTYNKDDLLISKGSINYLKRAKFNKTSVLSDIVEYVKRIGKDYNSKSYYNYAELVEEIYNDINKEIDLFTAVMGEYPNRPKLREVFLEKMNKVG